MLSTLIQLNDMEFYWTPVEQVFAVKRGETVRT